MRTAEFYKFIREREMIRLRKEAGSPWPWTQDPILQEYKFTNVKREHDKTTRKLKEVYHNAAIPARIYEPDFPEEMHLMNCATYRYFGTWEFAWDLGYLCKWDPEHVKELARERASEGKPVFTGAYVITNQGIKAPKIDVVVDHFLTPLHAAASDVVSFIKKTKSWRLAIGRMSQVQGFGGTGFMAKEVMLDTLFTPLWEGKDPVDFNTWCPAGPGARRGLNRLHFRELDKPMKPEAALEEMLALFELRGQYWSKNAVKLCLHDIQFQLCEFDKYERVRLGEGRPRSKYKRPV